LGRRPLGAILHSPNEPGELSQWLCHDDSTINIVLVIIIIITIIFSVEYWRHFESWVRGRSRSLKMIPFESLGTVSYSHSIATMAVSIAVSTQYTNVTDTQPSGEISVSEYPVLN